MYILASLRRRRTQNTSPALHSVRATWFLKLVPAAVRSAQVLEGAQVCTIDGTGEGRMVVDKKWEHLCVTTGDEPAQPVLLTKRTCKGIDA